MTTTTSNYHSIDKAFSAIKILKTSAAIWLATAFVGQWFFAYYILVFYGGSAVQGDWATWSNRMIHGIIEGDIIGNIAVLVHILLAFVITFCGTLQLIPLIRNNFPVFHRWNGRVYIVTALIISVAAIYMIWSRPAVIGGIAGRIGTSIDALLILIFALKTVQYAMQRQFAVHQRWALRLFIVVSGVWFYRIIRGFWMFVHDGSSPGTNNTLTGPFDLVLNFAGYLVPLLLLEGYFRIKKNNRSIQQVSYAAVIFSLTVAMAIGIYSAGNIFWLPNL